jgi:hypothetical protein
MNLTIDLPLPPRALSSNGSHGHWAKHNEAVQAYRSEACDKAGTQLPKWWNPNRCRVSYTFCTKGGQKAEPLRWFPKGGRLRMEESHRYQPRDISNALAAFKAGQDGLVDAGILVDDSARWMELGSVTIDPSIGPFVRVVITEATDAKS